MREKVIEVHYLQMHFELLCVFMLPHKFNKVNNKTRALCAVAITQNQFIQIETKRLRIVLIWHTPYSPTLTKINVGWFNIQHSGQKSYFDIIQKILDFGHQFYVES